METKISYLKQEYSLRPSEQNIHGQNTKKIFITPSKKTSIGYIWKTKGKGSGVWLSTHNSLKFPLTNHEIFILNEVMTRFKVYWDRIN